MEAAADGHEKEICVRNGVRVRPKNAKNDIMATLFDGEIMSLDDSE